MPDTIVIPFCRSKSPVSPHTSGESRSGSSASWTRRMPVLSSLAIKSAGLPGCNDQLHTANRSVKELSFMLILSQLSPVTHHASRIMHHASRITPLKLVFLLLKQHVKRRQRPVTARDVLLHLDLLAVRELWVRVNLLFQHA